MTNETTGTNYYYLADGLGSITEIQDADGNTVETYKYDSFGNPTVFDETGTEIPESAIGNSYMFAGYWYDKETGLYHCRTRYYDPVIGRFISKDIWHGDEWNPLTFNRYIYAVLNPINFVDPFGLKEDCEYVNIGDPKWKPTDQTKTQFDIESELVRWWITFEDWPKVLLIYKFYKYEYRLVAWIYRKYRLEQSRQFVCWDVCTLEETYREWGSSKILDEQWQFDKKEIREKWYVIEKYLYNLIPQYYEEPEFYT